MHFAVGFDQAFFVHMERVSIFHGELTATHNTETRTDFVTEFGLDLIQIQWQLFVTVYFIADQRSDNFFMCRA